MSLSVSCVTRRNTQTLQTSARVDSRPSIICKCATDTIIDVWMYFQKGSISQFNGFLSGPRHIPGGGMFVKIHLEIFVADRQTSEFESTTKSKLGIALTVFSINMNLCTWLNIDGERWQDMRGVRDGSGKKPPAGSESGLLASMYDALTPRPTGEP